MATLEVTYRLPSLLVLQRDPLPELTFDRDGCQITIGDPTVDLDLSIGKAWTGRQANPSYRFADVLKVKIDLPEPVPHTHDECYRQTKPILHEAMRQLITLLQVRSGQCWVGYMPSPFLWYKTPVKYTLWGIAEEYRGSGLTAEPNVEQRHWITTDTWLGVGESLRRSEEPPIPRILLEQATAFRFAGNLQLAVLSLAMACEIALKTYIRDDGGKKDPLYAYVVDKDRELSIFDYMDDVLESLTGEKLKKVLRADFNGQEIGYGDLRRLFQVRNKVVHEGRAYYNTDSGRAKQIEASDVLIFALVSSGLISWLENRRAGS